MQRQPQRNPYQVVRRLAVERHRPRQVAFHTPTAARREAAQTPDAVAQRDGRREHVGRLPQRKLRLAHVPPGNGQRRQQASVEHAARLQGVQGEDLARILAIARVHDQHHQLGAGNGGQRAVDSQVGGRVGIETRAPGQPRRHPQAGEERQRHQHAVSVKEGKMEDFRVHLPPAVWAGAEPGQQAAANHDG